MPFMIHSLLASSLVFQSEGIFIPPSFQDDRPIEQVIVISDVDGVVRESTEGMADPRIISIVKELLKNKNVDVTFISGTPIANGPSLETWRHANISLSQVFRHLFVKELHERQVSIYGVLGGQRMTESGDMEVIDEYSLDMTFEIGCLLLHAFLREALQYGTPVQKEMARNLQTQVDNLELHDFQQLTTATPKEFSEIIQAIRQYFDPEFRLISRGALIETHTSNPPWNTALSAEWLRQEIEKSQYLISHLDPDQRQIATGIAKRGEQEFNFLIISKINKGMAVKRHIEEKLKTLPNALIVTIGDTPVDFPMHQYAHLAFHVGLEHVWEKQNLPCCLMVRDQEGRDSQHVLGTLQVLEMIQEGIGKSFKELKYIPKRDDQGHWKWYSIRELE